MITDRVSAERMLQFGDLTVWWDETSRINFERDGVELCSLDSTDLSCLYGAYRQMQKELKDEAKV